MYYQVFAKTIDTIQELTYAPCNGLWHIKGDIVFTAFSVTSLLVHPFVHLISLIIITK